MSAALFASRTFFSSAAVFCKLQLSFKKPQNKSQDNYYCVSFFHGGSEHWYVGLFFLLTKKKEIRQKSHDFAISFTYNQI